MIALSQGVSRRSQSGRVDVRSHFRRARGDERSEDLLLRLVEPLELKLVLQSHQSKRQIDRILLCTRTIHQLPPFLGTKRLTELPSPPSLPPHQRLTLLQSHLDSLSLLIRLLLPTLGLLPLEVRHELGNVHRSPKLASSARLRRCARGESCGVERRVVGGEGRQVGFRGCWRERVRREVVRVVDDRDERAFRW